MWSEILTAVFLGGYVSFTARTIIQASTPPACVDLGPDCLATGMERGTPYAVHLYASTRKASSLALEVSPLTDTLTLAPRTPSLHLGTVESAAGFEDSCDNIVRGHGAVAPKPAAWYHRYLGLRSHAICESSLYLDIPDEWQNNKTNVYLTAVSTSVGAEGYREITYAPTMQLVSLRYTPEKKDRIAKRYLVLSRPEAKTAVRDPFVAVPPTVRFGPVAAFENYNATTLVAHGRSHWLRSNGEPLKYWPEGKIDTFVSPRDEYLPLAKMAPEFLQRKKLLSADGKRLPLRMTFVLHPVSWRKNAIEQLMNNGVDTLEKKFGTNQYDSDSLKLLFAGRSPMILLLTFTVSMLHMLFEILAMLSSWASFKEHCEDYESAQAVSARAILLDTVLQIPILAWLADEGEAKLVQVLVLVKIAFNAFRYYKLNGIQSDPQRGSRLHWSKLILGVRPFDAFKKNVLAERRKQLSSDDFELWALACQAHLLIGVFALWVFYQVVFVPQKSWLSAAIKVGAHLSYGGGFIAMTPQLYKNYYHRSVTHLPWIALTYNFLNTIIDDLFSFLIRMPNEHRISVFRDDVIFIIYWLQKWHYKREHARAGLAKK